ncbi:MAG TPA: hypothetical protein G4N95_01460 [Anaerolineae bacterium]|nr:hypothetical protein [Anaerolineae bacterium]
MEKQEAIEVVIGLIKEGKTKDVIIAELTERLNAPEKLVGRFVDSVFEQNQIIQTSGIEEYPDEPAVISQQAEAISSIVEAEEYENVQIPEIEPPEEELKTEIDPLEQFVYTELSRGTHVDNIVAAITQKNNWTQEKAHQFVLSVHSKYGDKQVVKSRKGSKIGAVLLLIFGIIILGFSGFQAIGWISTIYGFAEGSIFFLGVQIKPEITIAMLFTGLVLSIIGIVGLLRKK